MIESTQASLVQAACGAKPLKSARPRWRRLSASAENRRLSTMPTMTIRMSASPTALSKHAAQGGREHLRQRFEGGFDHAGDVSS